MKNSTKTLTGSTAFHEVFSKLLKRLSAADLKTFIEETAANNEAFLHRFIIQFIDQAPMPAEEKYAVTIESIMQLSLSDKKDEFQHHMNTLFEKAEQMIDQKNFLDGYLTAAAVIKKQDFIPADLITQWNHFVTKSFELLISIIKSEASYDLKGKIFDFLLIETKDATSVSPSPVKENWLRALLESATEENQLQSLLKLISEEIGRNRNQLGMAIDDSEEEQLVKVKLQVLQKLNRERDMRHLLESNKHIKSFREQLIDNSLQQHDLVQAKELIKEGKRLDERKGRIYLSTDWDEMLLKIAQNEQDVKSIRNLALQLFINTEFDFKYYHLMKQHYDPPRWKSQVDRIVTHIRKESSFPTKGIHAAAKIFIEEEEWGKLLLLLQKNANLEFAEMYFAILKEKYPGELLEIYRRAVRRYAEKNMGNEVYRNVANTLKKMQSLPGGRELVQSLAIELKVDYRNRKSFVDELNKIAL